MAEGNSALVSFLSDPALLAALAAVAAGAAWYIKSRPNPAVKPPIPLDNQSIELPVSCCVAPLRYHHFSEPILGVNKLLVQKFELQISMQHCHSEVFHQPGASSY